MLLKSQLKISIIITHKWRYNLPFIHSKQFLKGIYYDIISDWCPPSVLLVISQRVPVSKYLLRCATNSAHSLVFYLILYLNSHNSAIKLLMFVCVFSVSVLFICWDIYNYRFFFFNDREISTLCDQTNVYNQI
jgi:hypothetical protein